jgi:hypothetical protein
MRIIAKIITKQVRKIKRSNDHIEKHHLLGELLYLIRYQRDDVKSDVMKDRVNKIIKKMYEINPQKNTKYIDLFSE